MDLETGPLRLSLTWETVVTGLLQLPCPIPFAQVAEHYDGAWLSESIFFPVWCVKWQSTHCLIPNKPSDFKGKRFEKGSLMA